MFAKGLFSAGLGVCPSRSLDIINGHVLLIRGLPSLTLSLHIQDFECWHAEFRINIMSELPKAL
jgi:hypothetical protein